MAIVAGRSVAGGRGYAGTTAADLASPSTGAGVSQREDLANFISMITRDETPFMSSIGKTKATAIYHEWQTDELQTPGNSRIGEGWDYVTPGQTSSLPGGTSQTNPTPAGNNPVPNDAGGNTFNVLGPNRTRLGNYTQINGKTIAVSGTRRAIDQAGVADEYAYQLKKRGTELRRDLEFDLIHSYNFANPSGTRTMGGVQSWINDSTGARGTGIGTVELNGAAAPTTAGAGVNVPGLSAVASRVPLSLSQIDSVMQRIYQEGGKANKIMLSPKLRRDFSDLMVTDSGVRRNIDMDGKLRQSVDVYMSDFGDLMVMPNYIMGLAHTPSAGGGRTATTTQDSMALIYDSMWFSIATLRPLQEVDVGQRGDSTIGMMVEECTLEVKNPIGCGAIYDLA